MSEGGRYGSGPQSTVHRNFGGGGSSLGNLVASKRSELDAAEPAFREIFTLEQRRRFAERALATLCASLEDYAAADVLKKWRGVHVGPELLIRKIYFSAVRHWFLMEEMEAVFGFQARQFERDILELERWAKAEPALMEFADAIADLCDAIPAIVTAHEEGMEAAKRRYDQWIGDKRKARLTLEQQGSVRTRAARIITPKNARAAALLLQRVKFGDVAEQTGMDLRAIAELDGKLWLAGMFPVQKGVPPKPKPTIGGRDAADGETIDLESWLGNARG